MAELIQADCLSGAPHAFSTRRGAAADHVIADAQLALVKQIHSPDVVTVDDVWDDAARPEADAMVTSRPGIVLGIVTADCAPVLLHDSQASVIGAAHAGWRGAADGVIANTVDAMVELGATRENIVAAIGPCIAQASYEVDDALVSQFADADSRFFMPGRPGHWQFDLPGFVASRLSRAGVEKVELLGLDTYAEQGRFYSFRRATHRGEPTGGRQISMIGLHWSV